MAFVYQATTAQNEEEREYTSPYLSEIPFDIPGWNREYMSAGHIQLSACLILMKNEAFLVFLFYAFSPLVPWEDVCLSKAYLMGG